jgi:hypothetical protein
MKGIGEEFKFEVLHFKDGTRQVSLISSAIVESGEKFQVLNGLSDHITSYSNITIEKTYQEWRNENHVR